jgi:hypothetical protein
MTRCHELAAAVARIGNAHVRKRRECEDFIQLITGLHALKQFTITAPLPVRASADPHQPVVDDGDAVAGQ